MNFSLSSLHDTRSAIVSRIFPPKKARKSIEGVFGIQFGEVDSLDATDGVRITFANGEIVHLRPSGNAPEFRCYTEADTEPRAMTINKICTDIMSSWR